MQNRWSEAEAAQSGGADPAERQLALLAYVTHLIGAEPDLAMHGGGNTSCKSTLTNALGESQPALFIKASGMALAEVVAGDFVALDLAYLLRLAELPALSDEVMAGEFACHTLRPASHPASRRASVETLAHAVLPHAFVLHTHPSAILALTNREHGAAVVASALGNETATVPYAPAGLALAHAMRDTVARFPAATALVLMHHGLVTWGQTAREAYDATLALVSRAEAFLTASRVRKLQVPVSATSVDRQQRYVALAPVIRSVLGPRDVDSLADRIVLNAELDADVVRTIDSPEGKRLALSPPISPDYIVRSGKLPLWLDQPALDDAKVFRQQLTEALAAYQDDYRAHVRVHAAGSGFENGDFFPRSLLIPGLGLVAVGKNAASARMIQDITLQGLAVKTAIWESGANYLPLGEAHLCDMEFRAYQQAKTTPGTTGASLRGSVALVTGAAGAIGSGICEALLAQGCHVAASDLPGAALDALVEELGQRHPFRVVAAAMDVTSAASVSAGFAKVIRSWGGIDAVIVNAGIAHVAPLVELTLEAFRKLEAVNVEGTLLTLAEAGRHFALQGTGGDVVLVSTKNVFAPGAGFGAYSATKAASHQLARIASLEFAPLGVRVNMVAPDAVFSHGDKRSGLWAAVGPNRMKARGLDERGLEDYYRSRNLLKARVTAEHVARAVLFFLTHQTPTTGATIPVDGGLPDATPR
jgi:rhamnose utilization protein RhaD (predicted bifunctional aldolase and dehydrogenase)/NAD(P)-dependent dehydrogenase (short-subunit alcohol dehydrogenase family)